ncbi:MAG: DUF58 domain-containing protein [Clostridia bacterium]|nr:DUF58 domain-containing protein [Clostridia bacterium]
MKRRQRRSGARFRLVVLLAVVLTVAMLYTGDRMLSWGAFTCLALVCGAVLWHVAASALLTVHAAADDPDPVKGQSDRLEITVRNRSPFPVVWMELSCRTVDSPFLGVDPGMALSMPPFSRRSFSLDMTCLYKGVYEAGVSFAALMDPFGFLTRKLAVRGRPLVSVTVWPRRAAVPESADSMAVLEEKPALHRDFSEDLTSIFDMRDWREGDAFKRIHWKLSDRMGAWMVKEFDSTTRDEISVILDARPFGRDTVETIKYTDALVEAAYSICSFLLESGHPLRLTTQTDDIVHLHGADAADDPRFYRFLAAMPLTGTHSAEEIIEFESPLLSKGGRMIVIGPQPEDGLLASLASLADGGIDITLVIAVPQPVARPLSAQRAHRLEQSGIRSMVADPDRGLYRPDAHGQAEPFAPAAAPSPEVRP